MALLLASTARGQFVAGHVFVSDPDAKNCANPPFPGGDGIWEIDPQTGEFSLFVELPSEQCGLINGLAFTPDGSRLRASLWQTSQIVEFDSAGKMTVVLDADDGIFWPGGSNNLAYDAEGNFYVVVRTGINGRILRFPAGGGPAIVFADEDDGIGSVGGIAFTIDGDLYFANDNFRCNLLRITRAGSVSEFDQYGGALCDPTGPTVDEAGHLYVGVGGQTFRYQAGDPSSKKLLADVGGLLALSMSADERWIYAATFSGLVAIDPADGTVTPVGAPPGGYQWHPSGIAVAPVVAPIPAIPAVSEWGLIVMALLLLTVRTLMGRTARLHPCRVVKGVNMFSRVRRTTR
jgi:sugar lactone lactonase YvrE